MIVTHNPPSRRASFFSSTKCTNARQEHTTAVTSTSSSTFQQRALGIPEILERILSFLSLQDRQTYACLVCKEWSIICKGLVPIAYTWILYLTPNKIDNDAKYQAIQELVSLAHDITIRVDDITLLKQSTQQRFDSWTTMMNTLDTMTCEHIQRRVHPRLRSLHLKEGILGNLGVQLHQLPQLSTLATLRIDVTTEWDIAHLFTILKACPHLEDLSVKPTFFTDTFCRSIYLSGQGRCAITAFQEYDILHDDEALPTMTRLRTCSLYGLGVTLTILAVFLQASPHLTKLVLARCSYLVRHEQDTVTLLGHTDRSTCSPPDIIRLVGVHCPSVRTFHLSMFRRYGFGLDTQDVVTLLDTFPHLDEFNFSDERISPTFFKTVSSTVVNRITTLNLLPVRCESRDAPEMPLREILCTFEHLLHLRAPTSVYSIDDMDLNDVKGQLQQLWAKKHGLPSPISRSLMRIAKDDPAIARQYVWACRGLKTLHMTVGFVGIDAGFPEMSLIIFGFLSRMCPRLQELSLKRANFDLSLFGGFCLLTRLQELERIRIITNGYPPMDERDLLWVHPTPPSTWDRRAYPLLRHRTSKDLQVLYYGISPSQYPSKLVERGRELGVDLNKLGYGDDLLDWMDGRYSSDSAAEDDSHCRLSHFPKLQSFWIECREEKDKKKAVPQKLQEYVAKIRPNVDFDLCKERSQPFYDTTLKYY